MVSLIPRDAVPEARWNAATPFHLDCPLCGAVVSFSRCPHRLDVRTTLQRLLDDLIWLDLKEVDVSSLLADVPCWKNPWDWPDVDRAFNHLFASYPAVLAVQQETRRTSITGARPDYLLVDWVLVAAEPVRAAVLAELAAAVDRLEEHPVVWDWRLAKLAAARSVKHYLDALEGLTPAQIEVFLARVLRSSMKEVGRRVAREVLVPDPKPSGGGHYTIGYRRILRRHLPPEVAQRLLDGAGAGGAMPGGVEKSHEGEVGALHTRPQASAVAGREQE